MRAEMRKPKKLDPFDRGLAATPTEKNPYPKGSYPHRRFEQGRRKMIAELSDDELMRRVEADRVANAKTA